MTKDKITELDIGRVPGLDILTADRILQNVFREAGWKPVHMIEVSKRNEKKETHSNILQGSIYRKGRREQ
ncbi:hypothetical protein DWX43_17115 [Clostridium sp. AF19-22AC]|uniref:hypothetical protein n=1 Tax=Clostridia TaxID=186801 RepID=UPI000E51C563|nr:MULTISPECIES: hypothetical protein [Clostridia]RHR25844.1 hypothetical protein DWX43_17115 [Clostridium sp. AF19-22AC]